MFATFALPMNNDATDCHQPIYNTTCSKTYGVTLRLHFQLLIISMSIYFQFPTLF